MLKLVKSLIVTLCFVPACGDDGGHEHEHDGPGIDVPEEYSFDSRFIDGESSVSYSGQVMRQLLILSISSELESLSGSGTPIAAGATETALLDWFDFDSNVDGGESVPVGMSVQATYNDISTEKNLRGKLAGNDASTDHKDWNGGVDFAGGILRSGVSNTPTDMVLDWFEMADDAMLDFHDGTVPLDPFGNPVTKGYITTGLNGAPVGVDLKQVTEKFFFAALTFSQGVDDYLSNDVAGKGMMASNLQDEDSAYSSLEHAWDEGFGYFGASRGYKTMTDAERGDNSTWDVNNDGMIDLKTEYIYKTAKNAAVRDAEVTGENMTDQVINGFLEGRALIASASGELSADQLDELNGHRVAIIEGWERVFAAQTIHYINRTVAEMDEIGTSDYLYQDHVKFWGELKGFSLAFQFNPDSPLSAAQFQQLHDYIGSAPVFVDDAGTSGVDEVADYRQALLDARGIVATAFNISATNAEVW